MSCETIPYLLCLSYIYFSSPQFSQLYFLRPSHSLYASHIFHNPYTNITSPLLFICSHMFTSPKSCWSYVGYRGKMNNVEGVPWKEYICYEFASANSTLINLCRVQDSGYLEVSFDKDLFGNDPNTITVALKIIYRSWQRLVC